MSILSEEIIEDLPITKEYLNGRNFYPFVPKKFRMFNTIKSINYKFKSLIKYKIWNRFYVYISDVLNADGRFCVSVAYDRVTSTLYVIYKPAFRTYLNYFPGIVFDLVDDVSVDDQNKHELIVTEKHTDINTQYFFDILFTNIFSDSKCEEIMQKFNEQWIQQTTSIDSEIS